MIKYINVITMLIVVIISFYGLLTDQFVKSMPFSALILALVIFLNGLREIGKPLRKNLFIIAFSLFLISILRFLMN